MQIALQLKPNKKKIAEQIIIIKNTYHCMQKKICDKKAVLHKIRKRSWGRAMGQCMWLLLSFFIFFYFLVLSINLTTISFHSFTNQTILSTSKFFFKFFVLYENLWWIFVLCLTSFSYFSGCLIHLYPLKQLRNQGIFSFCFFNELWKFKFV